MNKIVLEIRNLPKIKLIDGKEFETFDLYDFKEGLWISKISITLDNKLIMNSNHFINLINDTGQEDGDYPIKRKPHKIYSRIVNNYYNIVKNTLPPLIINDRCIFLHNSFSTGNAGHDLFCIIDTLRKYKDTDIKFVLFDEIYNNNYNIIKLFISDDRIIKIKAGQIYNFKKQVFNVEQSVHNVCDYKNITDEILYKVNKICCTIYNKENLKKKVILIKNNNQDFIVRKDDCFNATLLFDYLRDNDWYICNPEKDDFFSMVYTLMNASVIITGQNGISCCNQIFYNLHAEIIGYKVNVKDNILKLMDKNVIELDNMCNGYYYNIMKKVIVSPLIITQEVVNQFKKLFEYYEVPDIKNLSVYYGTRNLYIDKECKKDLNGIKYGEIINFNNAVDLFNKTDDCQQLIYHIPSKRAYGMKAITMSYSENDFITITKNIT